MNMKASLGWGSRLVWIKLNKVTNLIIEAINGVNVLRYLSFEREFEYNHDNRTEK